MKGHTVCPRSSDPFYIISYFIKWVTTLDLLSLLKYYNEKVHCLTNSIQLSTNRGIKQIEQLPC